MTSENISIIRLVNQQISSKKFSSEKKLVSYMGALQAQDYAMSKWAIGVRLKNADEKLINSSIDKGDILRTHLLRPTWHFVSSEDIYWMLDLTASRIKNSMRSRNKDLGLTPEIFRKSNKLIRNALSGNNHLTREELIKLLRDANIKTVQNRASHLLMEAELDGIVCSGIHKGNKPTYALLEDRVKKSNLPGREQSLEKLATRYFNSRGPATINDFLWWSGLTIADARAAIEMIKPEMDSFEINSQTCWYFSPQTEKFKPAEKVFLLPTFDEFIISYKDRSAVMQSESHRKIISNFGIFRAIIVYNGKIIGTWKRIVKKDYLSIQIEYLNEPDDKIKKLVNDEAERFGIFSGQQTIKTDHKLVNWQ